MSLRFNLIVTPFSNHRIRNRRETFPAQEFPVATSKSAVKVKCNLITSTDLVGKVREKINGKVDNSLEVPAIHPVDIPSNLCMIDTLERLGVDRYFQSEIDGVLEETYRLWQQKEKDIFADVTCRAMAFRLLRVKGYEVSSDELAPYADQAHVNLQISDVTAVIELYRASQERIYEEESTLEKLHAWTSTYLKQQLVSGTISDKKLHKQVEYYLKNYHGILDLVGIRRSLDLYDIDHYQILKAADRFRTICKDLLAFSRQDFNNCQAQYQRELQLLQRWYEDCRLDKLNYGRDVLRISYFVSSAIIGDPELSDARLAFAKYCVLTTCIDDFFDHAGSREESYRILELVKEWKEKPAEDYGSKEVEFLFTAVYNTVNELAEMAYVEQGRCVKSLLIKLWVELLTSFKKELDSWTDDTALSLDEYLSSSWVSITSRINILTSIQFLGLKLSEEMLSSQECTDLCRHGSLVVRLLNDMQTFEKERRENTKNSVSILLEAPKHEGAITEEEVISKIKEIVEQNRRKLMQMVYQRGTIFPRKCKDVFLKSCRGGYYLYSNGDEFTSPVQIMEDMKLCYEPLTFHPLEANNGGNKN
uniref:Class I diterpene synthase 2, chloroplastic n=1 Tax=Vitex agnus-castus TaxID=54477 RepID=TPS2_VITAC|nr:RecName: Full=Class I diterpene synthase 2, chloroplastic; Short=VacTPS2; AltName: Full=(13S)-vitexifolin A synthase; AltName: Full=9,13-epoxylabda-14-ene synthase; AltName: Full=Viteagnusin D synthase; Flags: Precursor [Vitex agnus-castus]AUT77121.1 class I diterpene synthase [Vitex agnus-castus]